MAVAGLWALIHSFNGALGFDQRSISLYRTSASYPVFKGQAIGCKPGKKLEGIFPFS